MLLKWINQIISIINDVDLSEFIKQQVIDIVRKYPQAFYYPFKVTQSNIDLGLTG